LKASVVLTSGFGAPFFTATPIPERATGRRVAPSSLPCLTRASTKFGVRIAMSNGAPASISALILPLSFQINSILSPVDF
jgi:hypothetical protein